MSAANLDALNVTKLSTTQVVGLDATAINNLTTTQAGALKWARRYGEALVCVRYRHDRQRRHRYTTVELVVEHAPIRRRLDARDPVLLDIPFEHVRVLELVLAHNARYDGTLRLWALPRKVAEDLGLASRIVET